MGHLTRAGLLLLLTSYVLIAGPATPASKPGDRKEALHSFQPGATWPDAAGVHINAHGGGMLCEDGTYYWFGERRVRGESRGINVYSSRDLYNWRHEGVALAEVENAPDHDIARGCIMERPKVLRNARTGQYVMWFHLELKGRGYSAARAAVAVADRPAGPYAFHRSLRPNGNMSRDMTLFQDDDGAAYHIYASNDNKDMRICRLSDDYLSPTARDVALFSDEREAPAMFKHEGRYFLITSACTAFHANAANVYTSDSLWGPWKRHPNPTRGPRADKTFGGQSTFVLPVPGKKDAFIFMADRWNPDNLQDSRYLWLPIMFEKGLPVIQWQDEWDLGWFDRPGR